MRVKKFVGSSMQDAVAKMKAEFGENAVILHTKTRKAPWALSWLLDSRVEVIAALEEVASVSKPSRPSPAPPSKAVVQAYSASERSQKIAKGVPVEEPGPAATESLRDRRDLSKRLGSVLQNANSKQPGQNQVSGERPEGAPKIDNVSQLLIDKLKEADVEQRIARTIARTVAADIPSDKHDDTGFLLEILRKKLEGILRVVSPWDFDGGGQVVALIGPTGVGKTTTTAKLAANYALLAGKRVSLVTIDTFRIAAVDQLKTYADIIDIPLDVAFTPDELRSIVEERAKSSDLVLVDTAGHSQKNSAQMAELRSFLSGLPLTEVHLVLSASSRYQDLADIITKYSIVGPSHLIFTKLDETVAYGSILNGYALAKKPIAYLTDGQEVPENIEAADAGQIASLILGRERV